MQDINLAFFVFIVYNQKMNKFNNFFKTTDKMYDDGVDLKKSWKENCNNWEHDEMSVHGFFGKYRFLSNFYDAEVFYDGLMYPNSENAYQAAKIVNSERSYFQTCSAYESKKNWKSYKTKYTSFNWDIVKRNIMFVILFDKFTRNEELRKKLIETEFRHLEETNWWGDTYWGVCDNFGGNNLGKVLMDIRQII